MTKNYLLSALIIFAASQTFAVKAEAADRTQKENADWIVVSDKPATSVAVKSLDDQAYKAEKTKWINQISIEDLRQHADVEFGVPIAIILPGSPFQQLGFEAGDLIVRFGKVNANPSMLSQLGSIGKNGDSDVVIERRGTLRTIKVKQTDRGYGPKKHLACRIAGRYVIDEAKGKLWDDDMLVACCSINFNVRLAETALIHARDKGYNGPIGVALDALIAHTRLNHAAALSLGLDALKKLNTKHAQGFAWQVVNIAAVSGHMQTANELMKKYDLLSYYPNWDGWLQAANTISTRPGGFVSPASQADKCSYLDMKEDIAVLRPGFGREVQAIKQGAPFKINLNPEPGGYYPMELGPRVRDGQLSLTVKYEAQDDKFTPKSNTKVSINLFDANYRRGRLLILYPDATLETQLQGMQYAPLYLGTSDRLAKGEAIPIRLTCIDGILEIEVDEKRVYVGPLVPGAPEMTSLKWALIFESVKLTVGSVSWRSINKFKEGAQHEDVMGPLRKAHAEGRLDEFLKESPALTETADWNVGKLMTAQLLTTRKFTEAVQSAQNWAEQSSDPQAWLAWAIAKIGADLSNADEVLNTLNQKVKYRFEWLNCNYLYYFGTYLRIAGKERECIEVLEPIIGYNDATPSICIFWCYVALGEYANARKYTAHVFQNRYLVRPSEITMRFIDAAVAIRAGQPAPPLQDLQKLINKRMPKYLPFALALWSGQLAEKDMDAAIGPINSAGLWRFYKGLMAFAQKHDDEARKEFDYITKNFPNTREGSCTGPLLGHLDALKEKQAATDNQKVPWPYSKDSLPKIKLPKPSADDPSPPPTAEGANDFF